MLQGMKPCMYRPGFPLWNSFGLHTVYSQFCFDPPSWQTCSLTLPRFVCLEMIHDTVWWDNITTQPCLTPISTKQSSYARKEHVDQYTETCGHLPGQSMPSPQDTVPVVNYCSNGEINTRQGKAATLSKSLGSSDFLSRAALMIKCHLLHVAATWGAPDLTGREFLSSGGCPCPWWHRQDPVWASGRLTEIISCTV